MAVMQEQQRYGLRLKVQSADTYDFDSDMLKKTTGTSNKAMLGGSTGKNKIY